MTKAVKGERLKVKGSKDFNLQPSILQQVQDKLFNLQPIKEVPQC